MPPARRGDYLALLARAYGLSTLARAMWAGWWLLHGVDNTQSVEYVLDDQVQDDHRRPLHSGTHRFLHSLISANHEHPVFVRFVRDERARLRYGWRFHDASITRRFRPCPTTVSDPAAPWQAGAAWAACHPSTRYGLLWRCPRRFAARWISTTDATDVSPLPTAHHACPTSPQSIRGKLSGLLPMLGKVVANSLITSFARSPMASRKADSESVLSR